MDYSVTLWSKYGNDINCNVPKNVHDAYILRNGIFVFKYKYI